MCFPASMTGHRVGMTRWEWDDFVFFGMVMGSATVEFRTNHRDDGSVPNDDIRISDASVVSMKLMDDDGNDITHACSDSDLAKMRDEVLQAFQNDIDRVVDSFGWT